MKQSHQVPVGEPATAEWIDRSFIDIVKTLGMNPEARGILAVDGRSGSGKTTFAAEIADLVGGTAVVHTDDIAWNHSFFGWDDLVIDGVIAPFLEGETVSYRPSAWVEHKREGSIDIPSDASWLIIEGVGSARSELGEYLDAIVWVQSDFGLAERRGIARDGGDQGAIDFWHEWMASETPFLAEHRPWDRADLIVNGSPSEPAVNGIWVGDRSS